MDNTLHLWIELAIAVFGFIGAASSAYIALFVRALRAEMTNAIMKDVRSEFLSKEQFEEFRRGASA